MNICEVMKMKDILEHITFCITIITAIGTIIKYANTIFFQRKLMLPGKRILCELAQGIVIISATTWLITVGVFLYNKDEWLNNVRLIIVIGIALGSFIWLVIDRYCNKKNIIIIINEEENYKIEYVIDDQFLMCEKTNATLKERIILSRQILNNAVVFKDEKGNYIVKVCGEKEKTYNVTVEKKTESVKFVKLKMRKY